MKLKNGRECLQVGDSVEILDTLCVWEGRCSGFDKETCIGETAKIDKINNQIISIVFTHINFPNTYCSNYKKEHLRKIQKKTIGQIQIAIENEVEKLL